MTFNSENQLPAAARLPTLEKLEAVRILGVQVHLLTVEQLINQMADMIDRNCHSLILNVNVHCMNLAYQHVWLRNYLNQASIVFCDGVGVMLGARLLGFRIPQRFTPADWLWQLGKFVEPRGYSLYLLGARPGVAKRAAENLKAKYPGLRILGYSDGYFDKTPGSLANETVLREINRCKPNILILGFGMPLQEKWLLENWDRVDANIALSAGAVFDYISGNLRRAPRWMTDHGLEWLGRLIIEPQRLWKRYLIGNPLFLWRIVKQRLGLLDLW
jgi:N-acetylglucosaminyldiphosphoundecaprenol N-acetyl-beta-D-mannosaminyltransferase